MLHRCPLNPVHENALMVRLIEVWKDLTHCLLYEHIIKNLMPCYQLHQCRNVFSFYLLCEIWSLATEGCRSNIYQSLYLWHAKQYRNPLQDTILANITHISTARSCVDPQSSQSHGCARYHHSTGNNASNHNMFHLSNCQKFHRK